MEICVFIFTSKQYTTQIELVRAVRQMNSKRKTQTQLCHSTPLWEHREDIILSTAGTTLAVIKNRTMENVTNLKHLCRSLLHKLHDHPKNKLC